MSIRKSILVRNISSLSEARYCAGMGVDYIGFELNANHKDYIDESKRNEIIAWISGPKILGAFSGNLNQDTWFVIKSLKIDGFIFEADQIKYFIDYEHNSKVRFLDITNKDSSNIDLNIFDGIIGTANNIHLIPENKSWLGYEFDNVKKEPRVTGYAFWGSSESQVGANNYDDLMDALDHLDF